MPVKTPPKKQPNTSKQAKTTADELHAKPVITPTAISNKSLPYGWRWVRLGEVCDFIGGGTPSKNESKYWNGKLNWASVKDVKGNFLNSTEDTITELGLKNSASNVAEPNDLILITRISPGKSIISNIRTAVNQDLKIVKPKFKTSSKFLHYYFQAIEREVIKKSSGTTVLGITLNNLNEIRIPILDSDTQHAIVSKIEELLSELDKGKQQLETAQQQLKIYRQAVLKWAFVNTNYKEYILKDVTDKIQIGPFGTQLHKEDYIENGIPLINPMHIQDGIIQPDYSYSISREKLNSLPNYILKEGDVIMGRRGEMGRCGLVRKKENGWFCGTGSLYFRPHVKLLNSQYLYFYLSSEPVKKYLDDNAGGTTMANLNLKIVNEIPISLPSVEKQELIVQEIESRLSVCDKVEETLTTSLQQAETLRQSILKKAFEGKLLTPAAAQPNVYSKNDKKHQ